MQFIEVYQSEKPKAILVHGAYGDTRSLERLAKEISRFSSPVLVELDGHGASARHDYFSTRQEAEGIIKYIDREPWEIVLFYGVSLGAQIGLEVLAQRPSSIGCAVLEGGRYQASMRDAFKATHPFALSHTHHQVKTKSYWLRGAEREGYDRSVGMTLMDSARKVNKDNARRMLRSYYTYEAESASQLANIQTKTLFLYADHDEEAIHQSNVTMASQLPHADVECVQGFHGGLLLKECEVLAKKIETWMQ